MDNKTYWSYFFGVTGVYEFENIERPEILDPVAIRIQKIRNPKGDMIYMGDCFPFVDIIKYPGGVTSWGVDKVKVVNDILRYMIQHGLIIGGDMIITEEDLCEQERTYFFNGGIV